MLKIKNIIRNIQRARKYKSLYRQSVDVVAHKAKINTNPTDYYRFEFYKVGKTWEEKSRYIGEWGSMYWPYENNELKFNIVFTDKFIQKNVLAGMGLPTPELMTTIGKTREIRRRDQLCRFLDATDVDMVLKPISSTGGNGILVLSRYKDHFISGEDEYTKDSIWRHVQEGFNRGYLIEKRVLNPATISRLNPSALNTFRVVTIKTEDGVWHVANSVLKVAQGSSVVDNVGAGGISLLFDSNGFTCKAIEPSNNDAIEVHPDTGEPLIGVNIKEYGEVNQLALTASEKFGFMGTIGWDIASTLDGPVIIEANLLWGVEIQMLTGGLVSDEIASGLRKRSMFTGWDRSRMYPKFNR